MAILNFPPATGSEAGKTYEANGVLYTWDGYKWEANSESAFDDKYVNIDGDTMTGDLTVPSLNGGQLAGFRNQLINGNILVSQRFPFDATQNGLSESYTADRWYVFNNRTGTFKAACLTNQFSNPSLAGGGGNSLKVSSATSSFSFRQAIEVNEYTPGPFQVGSTWTFSIYSTFVPDLQVMWSSNGLTPGSGEFDRFVNRPTMTSLGNSRYSFSFTISSAPMAGTNCLLITFASDASPTSDKEIAGAQLEPGPVATPFEHRPIGTELALCQRYYQKSTDDLRLFLAAAAPSTAKYISQPRPVVMRATPTETGTVTAGTISLSGTAKTIRVSANGINESLASNLQNYTADAEL